MLRPLNSSRLVAREPGRAIGSQARLAAAAVAVAANLPAVANPLALVIPATEIVSAPPLVPATLAPAEADVEAAAAVAAPRATPVPVGPGGLRDKPHIGGEATFVTERSGAKSERDNRTRGGTRSESRVCWPPPVPPPSARAPSCPLHRRSLQQENLSAMAIKVDRRSTHKRGSDRV